MSIIPATITNAAAKLLYFSPTAWVRSWLIYLGVQTHVRGTVGPEFKPLHNICEYLNALHIYADEARTGKTRSVEAFHFCAHVRRGTVGTSTSLDTTNSVADLRQCLIYDSNEPNARLIGVEYLVPKAVFEKLDPEEQKLWHSHEFEVKSGMLVMPTPVSHQGQEEKWEKLETEAMKELVGMYGKLYHFWQVDRGDDIPLGEPKLMGSLTSHEQCDIQKALRSRNERFGVDHREKATARKDIPSPDIHENADSWWREAKRDRAGVYA